LTPCFTRVYGRHREFILDPKPEILKHVETIEQKVWQQYQVHLKRVPPMERAVFYSNQLELRGLRSQQALAEFLNEPVARITRHLRLLDLPEPVRRSLLESQNPAQLRYFTERRLRELLKVKDPRTAWRRFQGMLLEADREAGVWASP
jgi:hypothetical protein